MNRKAWIFPTLGALFTVPCGAAAFGEFIPPEPMTMEVMQPIYDREAAVYESAGLSEQQSGSATTDSEIEVMLEGGQCIGVVTASESPWPTIVLLTHDEESLSRGDRKHVSSVAWCEPFATRVRIRFDSEWQRQLEHSTQSREGMIHYRVFVGRTDAFDLTTLPRGVPNGDRRRRILQRMAIDRAVIAERTGVPDEGALFEGVRATPNQGALLWPKSPTTWATYRNAFTRFSSTAPDTVYPRVHPASVGEPVDAGEVSEALIMIEQLYRVLAVVDPADLPVEGDVPCATMRFGRLGDGQPAVQSYDLRVLGDALRAEGASASDTFCPQDAPRLYVVPESDPHEYVIRAFAAEGPRARRRPGRALEAPVYPAFAESVAACRRSNERCLEAAREARDGAHVPVDHELARELLARACAHDSETCPEHGELLLTMGRDGDAARVLEASCEAEHWDACARLADLYRLGRSVHADYDEAHRLYTRACSHRISPACNNAAALVLLQLSGGAVDDAPSDEHAEPEAEAEAEPGPGPDAEADAEAETAARPENQVDTAVDSLSASGPSETTR